MRGTQTLPGGILTRRPSWRIRALRFFWTALNDWFALKVPTEVDFHNIFFDCMLSMNIEDHESSAPLYFLDWEWAHRFCPWGRSSSIHAALGDGVHVCAWRFAPLDIEASLQGISSPTMPLGTSRRYCSATNPKPSHKHDEHVSISSRRTMPTWLRKSSSADSGGSIVGLSGVWPLSRVPTTSSISTLVAAETETFIITCIPSCKGVSRHGPHLSQWFPWILPSMRWWTCTHQSSGPGF